MKNIIDRVLILSLTLSVFIAVNGCSEDTDPDTDSQSCQVTNTCNDGGNDGGNDGNGNDGSNNPPTEETNKTYVTEGLYFMGSNRDNIKTDNGSLSSQRDKLIRGGASISLNRDYFFTNPIYAGKIDVDSPMFFIAGQDTGGDRNPFDIPLVSNFGYSIIGFFHPSSVNGFEPNARIVPLQDVTAVFNNLGNDGNTDPQTIVPLTAGRFRVEMLNSSALYETSTGDDNESITFFVNPNMFSRNADGVLTLSGETPGFSAQTSLEDLFNGNAVDIHVVLVHDGNPNRPDAPFITHFPYEL
jgi:hypothetical protein